MFTLCVYPNVGLGSVTVLSGIGLLADDDVGALVRFRSAGAMKSFSAEVNESDERLLR